MRCAVFYFYPMEYGIRKQRTDIREQISDNRNQRTEIRGQKSENGNQILEDRYQKADIRKQMSEISRQKTEIRRQKTEDRKRMSEIRKQETDIRNQISRLWAVICLRVSDPRLPAVFLFPQTEAFRNMLGNDPLCVFCPCIER